MWCDYKPEVGGIGRKCPHNLKLVYDYILNLAKQGELVVWHGFVSERDKYRELYRKGEFPFNPDEPADMFDGALDRAIRKNGWLRYLIYRGVNLLSSDATITVATNAELTETEFFFHNISVLRDDLIRLAEKDRHKPLFLYPEVRTGKTLKEIWPSSPTLSGPVEKEGKASQPLPKEALKRKPTSKKKQARSKAETASKPKPKPKLKSKPKPKSKLKPKAKAAPNTRKGIIKTIQQKVEKTSSKALTHSSDFRSMEIHGVKYFFTTQQARVVQYLFEQPTHEASDATISENCEVGDRIRDTFKKHPAWGKLIIQGGTRGTRKLDLDPKD